MKVDVYKNDDGEICTFSFPNWKVSRNRATNIVASIPGVTIKRRPKKLFSWFREEVFCEFELNGIPFTIDEPFGDNSHYDVCRQDRIGYCPEIDTLIKAFQKAW